MKDVDKILHRRFCADAKAGGYALEDVAETELAKKVKETAEEVHESDLIKWAKESANEVAKDVETAAEDVARGLETAREDTVDFLDNVGEVVLDGIDDIDAFFNTATDWLIEAVDDLFETGINICEELCFVGITDEGREFCETTICNKALGCIKEITNNVLEEVDELIVGSKDCYKGKVREFKECVDDKVDSTTYNALNLDEAHKKCKKWGECTVVSILEKPLGCHVATAQKGSLQLAMAGTTTGQSLTAIGIDYNDVYDGLGDFTCQAAKSYANANGRK